MIRLARDLVRYHPLIVRLAKSQIALRYRQSILGFGWAVIQPVGMMLIFTFALHKGAGVPSEGEIPYPLLVYCALLPWQFFSSCLTFGVPSLVQFASVIRKVYVPREAFPLAAIATSFFDFALAAVVFVGLLIYFHGSIVLGAAAWWAAPLFLLQVVFTAGVLFFGSALCVRYRDIRHGVAFGIYVWMFLSPVMVPLESLTRPLAARAGWLPYAYLAANPMAAILDGYRRALLHGTPPEPVPLAVAAGVSLLLFVAGYRYFKTREMTFADVL